jgi:hypothetical protein
LFPRSELLSLQVRRLSLLLISGAAIAAKRGVESWLLGQPQVIERYGTRLQSGAKRAHFDGADGDAVTLNRYSFRLLTPLPEPTLA